MPRLTVDFGEKFDELLTRRAKEEGTTKTEIIRRAVAYYDLIRKETAQGNKISLTNERDEVLKDLLFP